MNKKTKAWLWVLAIIVAAILVIIIIASSYGGALFSPSNGAGGGVATGKPECNDGRDNDGDGRIDMADTGCPVKNDNDESNCGDGVCEGYETPSYCPVDCGPVQVCGNNIIEGTEICDGTALRGQTCVSQGFSGGILRCRSDCTGYDTSGCYTNSCTETDGGNNLVLQGTTSGYRAGSPYSYTDSCGNSTYITEYYCSGIEYVIGMYNCANNYTTCSNGACI